MPKIAMPSISMALAPWTESLKVAAENNFDAFEVIIAYPSADLDTITQKDIKNARQLSAENDMEICVHAPFFELNIAAFYKSIREESVRYIKKAIDFCSDLGAKVIVVHTGKYTYDYPSSMTKENNSLKKMQWDHNIGSLRVINDHAVNKGVTVCLENIGIDTIDETLEQLLEIRQAVGDSLKFTLDIGHARLYANSGVEKGISLLGENIHHIHFTDNNGIKDDHLPIGDGNFNYSNFIDFIKNFQHIVTLEVVDIGQNPEAILRSREYFNGL
jgi:sugar phosphate isomerase/epimerase